MKTSATWVLTVASIKMWTRDRAALFWNFALPIIFMSVLGVFNFGSFGTVNLGVVDHADNDASRGLIEDLREIEALRVWQAGTIQREKQALMDGDRELLLVLPAGFGASLGAGEVEVLYNEGRPREVQVGQAIVREALNQLTITMAGVRPFRVSSEPITSRSFSYIDFLLPGIVAMSVMQLGLFSVSFGFIYMRKQGILRRLWATPVHPGSFLFAQVVTRLLVSLVQTMLLIGTAVFFFDAEVVGNIGAMLLLALIGGGVFLSMGFVIAGWAKSENVAAPLANLIAMPMMFLSGVFFGREFMPDVLQSITAYLPLTYLADGMRSISSQGASLSSQGTNLIGLGVWFLLSFAVATRVFRWE